MPIDAGIADPNSFYKGAENMNSLLRSFATKRAGGMLASGDQAGAVSELQQSGQIDEANALQQHQLAIDQASRAYQTKMVGDIATQMDNVGTQYGWDKVLPTFDRLTPMFKQQGATDQQIQGMRAAIAADPQSTVRAISNNSAKAMEQYTLHNGDIRYDASGRIIASGGPEMKTLGPGQSLYEIPPPTGPQQQGGGALPQEPAQQPGPDQNTPAPSPQGDLFGPQPDNQAVAMVESGGNPNALGPQLASGERAEGSMQTLPSTLINPGYGVRPAQPGPDGVIPPEEKARVGRDYLSALTKHYGNPTLGLIAYNWGPSKMERWVASGARLEKLPPDVKQYLGSVLVAHARGQSLPVPPSQHSEEDGLPHRLSGSGPRMVAQGTAEWRPMTGVEQKQYPGADGMTPKGPHYPPAQAMQAQQIPSDDALKLAAQTHILTGQMPPLGMNNTATRSRILELESQISKEHGWNGADIANLRAQYKANSAALNKLQTQRSQIGAYEETVRGSMSIVEENAGALANSGFVSANRAVNWWKRETNDPAMAQLDNSINTTVNEYAKVISNATGGGVTSDAARARAEELVNSADSPQSLHAKLDILRREMKFRVDALDHRIGQLGSTIHGMLSNPSQASKPTKVGHYDPTTGKIAWQ